MPFAKRNLNLDNCAWPKWVKNRFVVFVFLHSYFFHLSWNFTFRRYGESGFVDSKYEFNENPLILDGLDFNQMYEVRVVAVNGHYCAVSDIEEIETTAVVVTDRVSYFKYIYFFSFLIM